MTYILGGVFENISTSQALLLGCFTVSEQLAGLICFVVS
jgi:hypothetical protein